jgi:retron-type reverse transcriptase
MSPSIFNQLTTRKTLRQAFERVRDRAGCPGADGMSVHDFAMDLETELGRLEDRLLRRRYRPFPLLRFAVGKRSGGVRHLCVPTVRDRVAQTAALLVTQDLFEAEFEESRSLRRNRTSRFQPRRGDGI